MRIREFYVKQHCKFIWIYGQPTRKFRLC